MTAVPKFLFMDRAIVPFDQGKIHVTSEAVKYGGSVFEGLRAYWSKDDNQLYVFRLPEHIDRLINSMKMMRFEHSYSRDDLRTSILETLRANQFKQDVHIRQTAFLGNDGTYAKGPVGLSVVAMPLTISSKIGMDACISSWSRINDAAMPPRMKCSANYHNGRLVVLEARMNGYDMGLIMNFRGKLSESPGAAAFMIRDGTLITPTVTSDILESITRLTIIEICRSELKVQSVERDIDRTEIYVCDEFFIAGTGWEIIPILSVDRIPMGDGKSPGPITSKIQSEYADLVRGRNKKRMEWLTAVY